MPPGTAATDSKFDSPRILHMLQELGNVMNAGCVLSTRCNLPAERAFVLSDLTTEVSLRLAIGAVGNGVERQRRGRDKHHANRHAQRDPRAGLRNH